MSLHPEVQALLDSMRDLETFLRQNGDDFWSAQIAQAAGVVARSDAYGVKKFLGLFGGMGSLNDFVLFRDGKWLDAENDHLARLRSKAWQLADKLRPEIDR